MPSRHYARASALAGISALAGCAAGRPSLAALPVREYRGQYTSASSASWFRPCGATRADSAWWVSLEGRADRQLDRARASQGLAPGTPVYVRWCAARSDGSALDLGPRPGAPALLVREVLEVRPATPDACAGA